jgi:RNA polymerase sigma-70 factor, ECF subfamily
LGLRGTNRNEVFVELFALHQRRICGFIHTFIPNPADAEDVLQETSLLMWRKFDEFELGTDFAAWACQVARNKVLNFLKGKRRSRLCFDEDLIAQLADLRMARAQIHSDDQIALGDCLDKLSQPDRLLLKLAYTKQRRIKDVAQQLRRPAGSIYTSLHRIRHWLLDCVRQARDREELA